MKLRFCRLAFCLVALSSLLGFAAPALSQATSPQTGQVRAVFFTSPTCSFCRIVEERDLPPLEAQYGDQLHLLRVDTSTALGSRLMQTMWSQFDVAAERRGTPTIVVNDTILVGAAEIPEQFPGLIAELLAAGGNDWPTIPGIEDVLELEAENAAASGRPLWLVRLQRDLPGNYLSVALLALMLVAATFVVRPSFWRSSPLAARLARVSPWVKIAIALIGFGVAIYLTVVETAQTEAWCGPVGQCNVVQQSRFAILFGFLPMALFGALGYAAILATYLYGQWKKGPYAGLMPLASFVLTAFGFGFSIWLTYLQPFVIGATCSWCLTSAVTMSLGVLLNAGPGWAALNLLQRRGWKGYLRSIKHGVQPATPAPVPVRRQRQPSVRAKQRR